jgi:hypothetical protein
MKDFGSKLLLSLFGKKAKKILVEKTEEQLNKKINEILQETNNVFEHSKYKNSLQIINFKMPVQVEDDLLLTDIYFNIEGEINWEKIKIEFPLK